MLDSQPVWLRAIENILAEAGFPTVSTLSSDEALKMLSRVKFAVFLIGIDGQEDWEQLINAAARRQRTSKRVVIAADDNPLTVERALEIGVDAYVVKRAEPEDIPFVVRQVLLPEVYEVRPSLERAAKGQDRNPQQPGGLTPREQEILGILAQGSSNAEIAQTLGISETTVKGHLWRLYQKLGVPNRTSAARWVARSQLLARE
jgi:DNA-binding NarL/FixJ family response regulator